MLLNNKWKRPIYFSQTVPESGYYGLQDYFQLEGLAYRLIPIKTKNTSGSVGRIDTDILYQNMQFRRILHEDYIKPHYNNVHM